VVKAGDIVKVKVLEVDVARKRIALTRRLDDAPAQNKPEPGAGQGAGQRRDAGAQRGPRPAGNAGRPNAAAARQGNTTGRPGQSATPANNALAEAFARARKDG